MVGSALTRRLSAEDCTLLTAGRETLDLTDQLAVRTFFKREKPDAVVLAAARVGGIHANNTFPADFLRDNLLIETNVIHSAFEAGTEKLLFLGSSCIYPKFAEQPITEEALLTGPLEPTNEWYAIAKIAGVKMCQAYRRQYGADFIAAQPTNLFGPGDNYDPETSHVLPALIRRFHEAKITGAPSVTLWGTGTPLREFMHVDDLADGLVFLLENYSDENAINIGSGSEVSIRELAEIIAGIIGCEAELTFDPSKPDGTPRKLMDSSRLHALGWNRVRSLRQGIIDTLPHYYREIAERSG